MRATVVVSEYLTYVPALIIFIRHYSRNQGNGTTTSLIALIAILMQPASIIIDHGHFQYNNVMLGFVVAFMSVECLKGCHTNASMIRCIVGKLY